MKHARAALKGAACRDWELLKENLNELDDREEEELVATERHLWLNLSELQDKERFFLLDAPLSPSGLSGAVDTVVKRFQKASKRQDSSISSLAIPRSWDC